MSVQSFCHKTHGHFTSGPLGLEACLFGASATNGVLTIDEGYYYKEGLSQGIFSCNKTAVPDSENISSDQNQY